MLFAVLALSAAPFAPVKVRPIVQGAMAVGDGSAPVEFALRWQGVPILIRHTIAELKFHRGVVRFSAVW